jgi:hypothetical protein
MDTSRFIANKNKREVHDTQNKISTCGVDQLRPEHMQLSQIYSLEGLDNWLHLNSGYNACPFCLPSRHVR